MSCLSRINGPRALESAAISEISDWSAGVCFFHCQIAAAFYAK